MPALSAARQQQHVVAREFRRLQSEHIYPAVRKRIAPLAFHVVLLLRIADHVQLVRTARAIVAGTDQETRLLARTR